MADTIAITKLRDRVPVADSDLFILRYDVLNYPGMSAIWAGRQLPAEPGTIPQYETTDQAWIFKDGEYASLEEAIAAWTADRDFLLVRERTAEALRRLTYGLIRPLWRDLTPAHRDSWLQSADIIIRLFACLGLQLTLTERKDG